MALGGACSLIDLWLCSADFYVHTPLHVEDELFDSDNFPISITVDLNSPVQDFNAALSACTSSDCASFLDMVQIIMNKHKFSRNSYSRSFPAWCNNLHMQRNFLLWKARQSVFMDFWVKYKKVAAKLRQVIKNSKRQFLGFCLPKC